MIDHLIRQERDGGYWLIRAEGRAIELNDAGYRLMACLHETQGLLEGPELRRLAGADMLHNGSGILSQLRTYGLDRPSGWAAVRHVPCDVPSETLPANAVVAPKRIYFEITRSCNLSCRSCFNNSRHALPGELTHQELLDVNRQAYELGVFEIRYTGGECTIVPGFPDVVADARRRGFYVSIGTNGVYTDEQLEWLPHCGIDWFIISLDGDRDTNDAVRGAGTYDRVLNTLKALGNGPSTRIRLNMVVARHNLGSIEAVARVAADNHASSLNLIPLRPYGRSVHQMTWDMFNQEDFYEFIREVNRLRKMFRGVTFSTTIDLLDPEATTSHDLIVQKKTTCAAGVEACVVGPLGHVYGCSYSPASFPDSTDLEGKAVFIAGNLRDDDLRTIWRDSRRWSVFRDLSHYKNAKCHPCGHYQVRCSGSCQIMSWYELKHQRSVAVGEADIKEFLDPYCFRDLLDERGRTADLSALLGGAGMDGFR
ncbi:MAG: radical SAM protein [Acidobacteriia bacterium]|nr:radical SAM protein [Terriglobia bacterium]